MQLNIQPKAITLLSVPRISRCVVFRINGSGREMWRIAGTEKLDYSLPGDSDIALYNEGYVVVVPMVCDEHDNQLLSRLKKDQVALPEWPHLKQKKRL
jgi:hypothetical protein